MISRHNSRSHAEWVQFCLAELVTSVAPGRPNENKIEFDRHYPLRVAANPAMHSLIDRGDSWQDMLIALLELWESAEGTYTGSGIQTSTTEPFTCGSAEVSCAFRYRVSCWINPTAFFHPGRDHNNGLPRVVLIEHAFSGR